MYRLSRRNRAVYKLAQALLSPVYILWWVSSRYRKSSFALRLGEVTHACVGRPVRKLKHFIRLYFETRPWKRLIWASPIIVAIAAAGTLLNINASRHHGGIAEQYYEGAMRALQAQNFENADFLFGKLLGHQNYKDDPSVMLNAMVVAKATGNATRYQALHSRLIDDMGYEPAQNWIVASFIQSNSAKADELAENTAIARGVIETHPNISVVEKWRVYYAQLLIKAGEPQLAVQELKKIRNFDPTASKILAQAYLSANKRVEALEVVEEMTAQIKELDPELKRYFVEKVETLAFFAEIVGDLSVSIDSLEEAARIVEQKRLLSADQLAYDVWLSEIYFRLYELHIRRISNEGRIDAFRNFDKAIRLSSISSKAGGRLNRSLDPEAGYPLLSGQIIQAVSERGGPGAHLHMGMDEWIEGAEETARRHFTLSWKMAPKALEVLRMAAIDLAQNGSSNINVFSGDNKSSYQRSLELLDMIVAIDATLQEKVALDRCEIYAMRQNWSAIIAELSDGIDEFSEVGTIRAYQWLIQAYENSEQPKLARDVSKLLQQARTEALAP